MRWWLLVLAGCVTVPEKPVAKAVLYVDASAAEGGDGSLREPLKALVLQPNTIFHLASGLYPLNGTVPRGVELVGDGEVVLYAEGDAPFVVSAVAARLEHLTLQGGQWGLEVSGDVDAKGLKLSGQRQGCVDLRSGVLKAEALSCEGTLPETLGLRAAPGTQTELRNARFSGALKRAIDAQDAAVSAMGLQSEGPAQALHAVGGKVALFDASARRGSGAAFSMNRGKLELTRVEVVGHEYAVLAGDAEVVIQRLTSDRAQFAAVALERTKATLSILRVTSPGAHGAVELLDSTTELSELFVLDGVDQAVFVRKGSLTARRIYVTNLRGLPADAVHVRDAKAAVDGVLVKNVDGAGVGVTAVADADVRDLRCERCGHGALTADRRSHVRASKVVMVGADAPAVYVADDAQVEVADVEAAGQGPAIWAECEGTTHVTVSGQKPARDRISGGCVEVKQ